jgi:hypothetical protein
MAKKKPSMAKKKPSMAKKKPSMAKKIALVDREDFGLLDPTNHCGM